MEKTFVYVHYFWHMKIEQTSVDLTETLHSLSSVVALMYSHVVTTKYLRANITHIMTDPVSKNLKIEVLVAKTNRQ